MTRSITIGGVERADLTRLESFSFQESAYRGEAGAGGFDVDSDLGAITVPAWKNVVAIDADGGQFYTGQTVDRGVGRGPFSEDSSARWDVQTIDINTIMDDVLLRGSDCNRPDETDVQRMTWLIGTELPSHGITIGMDYLSTADPEDVDAEDYRKQGVYPRSVADACAENSGKNWYLFFDVGVTDQLQIWYGAEALTTRTCDYGISSVLDDIDDYGVVWPAEWPEGPGLSLDPSRVYSAVQVVYGSTDPPHQTFVNRPATEAAFKRRQAVLFDSSVKKESTAIKLGEHYLDAAETEDATITVAVTVPTTHVNAFQHGQRIPIRAPHLGYDSPTYMRCRTRTIEPAGTEGKNPGLYRVTLMLKPSVKVTRFGGRPTNDVPGQGDNPSPPPGPADTETDTGACATPTLYQIFRQTDPGGTYMEGYGTIGVGPGYVGSSVYYNEAYTVTGCPIGGGAWEGWSDQAVWAQFTAPADDPTYFGLRVTIDLTAIISSGGYQGGFIIRVYGGAGAANLWGAGSPIGSMQPGVSTTFDIPRNLVNWGGVTSLIIEPDWLCDRNGFYCNSIAYFGNPAADGRGQSGIYHTPSVSTLCPARFVPDTGGNSGWVPGYGDVDGANATFELISWDGTGVVEASINGLIQPASEVTLDTVAMTATLDSPPPEGAVVLFLYKVVA